MTYNEVTTWFDRQKVFIKIGKNPKKNSKDIFKWNHACEYQISNANKASTLVFRECAFMAYKIEEKVLFFLNLN